MPVEEGHPRLMRQSSTSCLVLLPRGSVKGSDRTELGPGEEQRDRVQPLVENPQG